MIGMIKKSVILLVVSALLISCSLIDVPSEDLFQFKGAYVGDNSAVVNIASKLPHAEQFSHIMLHTKTEPFGMTVSYDSRKKEGEHRNSALYNAAFLLVLIPYAEWVTMDFNGQEFHITRQSVEE